MDINKSIDQELQATKDELEATKKELEKQKNNYQYLLAMLENLPNPIFMKDENAKFIFFNKKYAEFFGMDRSEYLGKDVLSLDYLSLEARQRYQKEDLALIESGQVLSYEADYTGADGEVHPSMYWSHGIYDVVTNRKGLVGEIVDISKEKRLREDLMHYSKKLHDANLKLEKIAEIDPGTGVYNRLLLNRLQEEDSAGRSSYPKASCALLLDLDLFKNVNDTFGHIIGDKVLKQFAQMLQTESREHDVPIRYGGDEFILLINNADIEAGKRIAERLRNRCANEIVLPDGSHITCSIGVTELSPNQTISEIISVLDKNLYEAKKVRNTVIAK